MSNKTALHLIINYLTNSSVYYCWSDELLYSATDPCSCAEDMLQKAFDAVYLSLVELFQGYRIDPYNDLTDEAKQDLQEQAEQAADEQHVYFGNMTYKEALEAIIENKKIEQLLLDTYQFTAHK